MLASIALSFAASILPLRESREAENIFFGHLRVRNYGSAETSSRTSDIGNEDRQSDFFPTH